MEEKEGANWPAERLQHSLLRKASSFRALLQRGNLSGIPTLGALLEPKEKVASRRPCAWSSSTSSSSERARHRCSHARTVERAESMPVLSYTAAWCAPRREHSNRPWRGGVVSS